MRQPVAWRSIQRENFTDLRSLLDFLDLDLHSSPSLDLDPEFPLNVPKRLVDKMEKGNWNDPLLKQFLPIISPGSKEGFSLSPTQEESFRSGAKLLQKYQGRALLLCTSSCVMNCRFCFRQNFAYEKENRGFANEIDAIRDDQSILEVILSGGDPLSLANRELKDLVEQLSSIDHVELLRIHTRFPIGIPERIDEELIEILERTRLQTYFVIHSNHPRELDLEILSSLKELKKRGIVLLHQAVLTKGINDDFSTLFSLYKILSREGIIPYYLHQLDRISGSEPFEVEEERGRELIEELMRALPGYAVPRYVKEIAGKPYKTPLLNESKRESSPDLVSV